MPNDAKLGMVVGVAVVLTVAVVFFRKDRVHSPTVESGAKAASVGTATNGLSSAPAARPVQGKTTAQEKASDGTSSTGEGADTAKAAPPERMPVTDEDKP